MKVKTGGLIELRFPELEEGTTAEVIVVVGSIDRNESAPLSDLIGSARGAFISAAEADEFVSQERKAWQS